MKRRSRSFLILGLAAFLAAGTARADIPTSLFEQASAAGQELPRTQLVVGGQSLKVEIASTPQTMSRGLMFRSFLPSDQGMLFVFPTEHKASFWMKNTSIPLSIAYIGKDGKILEIYPLVPFEETPVKSKSESVSYALEVNRDWFNVNNIKPGMQIENLPLVKAVR